jgi:hypothetical protein
MNQIWHDEPYSGIDYIKVGAGRPASRILSRVGESRSQRQTQPIFYPWKTRALNRIFAYNVNVTLVLVRAWAVQWQVGSERTVTVYSRNSLGAAPLRLA